MKVLMETAMLIHESNRVFVPHAKSNFYFSLGERTKIKKSKKNKEFVERMDVSTPDGPSERSTDIEGESLHFGVLKKSKLSADRQRIGGPLIPVEDYHSPDSEGDRAPTPLDPKRDLMSTVNVEEAEMNLRLEQSSGEEGSLATENESSTDKTCDSKAHLFENPGPWGEIEPQNDDETAIESKMSESEILAHQSDVILDGIVTTLANSLQNLPDSMVKEVVTEAVMPEYVLVLANHPSSKIRASAVTLLWQYIKRTDGLLEKHGYRMLQLEGYVLLANQLHQFEATENVVNACLGIIHNRKILLYECPEIPTHVQITICAPGLVPLLALMPNSLGDVAMAHSLILHVHELCAKVSGLLRNYSSIALFEALCKTLWSLAHSTGQTTDICGQDSREILFNDLHDFLRLIGLRFITAYGAENLQTVDELLHLLMFMSIEDPCKEGNLAFRSAVCVVLEECLADVQSRISQIDTFSSRKLEMANEKSFFNIYGGSCVPSDDMADLLVRTVTLRDGSTAEPNNRVRRRHETGGTMTTVTRALHGGSGAWTIKNPDNVKLATRPELVERYVYLIDFSVEFFLHLDTKGSGPGAHEEALIFSVLTLMLNDLQYFLSSGKSFTKALYSNKQKLKSKLISLINFCLSPEMPRKIRLKIVKTLCYESNIETILRYLLNNDYTNIRLFNSFMRDFMEQTMDDEDLIRSDAEELFRNLSEWGIIIKLPEEELNYSHNRKRFRKQCSSHIIKTLSQYDELTKIVRKKALKVIQVSAKAQDEERKKMMVAIRDALSEKVQARKIWQEIIELICFNEKGSWYFSGNGSSTYWALGEMEGTQRTRIRLERHPLDVGSTHFLDDHKDKGVDRVVPGAFGYLLKAPTGMSSVIIAQLSSNDRILHMEQGSLVLPSSELTGEILVSQSSIYFVQSSTDRVTTVGDLVSLSILKEDIQEVHSRWYQLNDCAIELFLLGGHTKFFSFNNSRQRDGFLGLIVTNRPDVTNGMSLEKATKMWQEGVLTNFDYLMQLNKLAGRTFNDLMQYPVFPYVLADYSSAKLNLNDPKSFRNLARPISVQNPDLEEKFQENYQVLKGELSKSCDSCCPSVGPFHYGSHYSNSGIVLHFMLRIPPFTAMFLQYQDGKFDFPDRTFHDVGKSYALASGESSSDVKELIPDLFCLPEILVNTQGFDFGLKQDGTAIDSVVLPPYAVDDPDTFIRIHRQALEADHVRENLHSWIDLVFGFKQTGQPAVEAVNVFHPATYYGFDLSTIKDPVQRIARATMIKTYGQTPKKLFDKPHPKAPAKPRYPIRTELISTIQKKDEAKRTIPEVIPSVEGLKWGNFIGSPAGPQPTKVWECKIDDPVSQMFEMGKGQMYGVQKYNTVALMYNREESNGSGKSPSSISGSFLLSWNHPDGIVRAKFKNSENPVPLIHFKDRVTYVEVGGHFFWFGFESGNVCATKFSYDCKTADIGLTSHPMYLYGHKDQILNIHTSSEFGVAVTASKDKTVILWDTVKSPSCPTYIKSIEHDSMPYLVEVSKTSGHIVTAGADEEEEGNGVPRDNFQRKSSIMTLFTINGRKLARRKCEPAITALTMSAAPEGTSVNVVATGHGKMTGVIRLWSSWDLSPVRDIATGASTTVVALRFTSDNQALYAATSDSVVMLYEKEDFTGLKKPPKFFKFPSSS